MSTTRVIVAVYTWSADAVWVVREKGERSEI